MPAKAIPDDLALSPAHEWLRQRAAEHLRACAGGALSPTPAEHAAEEQEARGLARHLAFMLGGRRALRLAIAAEWRSRDAEAAQQALLQLGVQVRSARGDFEVAVPDYVWIAPRLPGFRLIDRRLERGYVAVQGDDLVQLAIEAQTRDILTRNPGAKPDPEAVLAGPFAPIILAAGVAEQLRLPPPPAPLAVAPGSTPPCVQALEAALAADQDIGHAGRFALVAFLGAAGQTLDAILARFRKRRDFDEATTRYHIEHILGKNREQPYQPPGCAKMQSDGLCPMARRDDVCRRVHHPLAYARAKGAT